MPERMPADRAAQTYIAPLVGYGTEDWFNVGLGIRVGATFPSGVYIGGIFVYHLGKSQEFSYYLPPPYGLGFVDFKVRVNTLYLGPEFGYDARVPGGFSIRPYFSLGYLSLMASAEIGGSSSSDSKGYFFVSPGLMLNVAAGDRLTIGMDGRYVIIAGEEGASELDAPGISLSLGFTP